MGVDVATVATDVVSRFEMTTDPVMTLFQWVLGEKLVKRRALSCRLEELSVMLERCSASSQGTSKQQSAAHCPMQVILQ